LHVFVLEKKKDEENESLPITWGELLDKMIEAEGMKHFGEEYFLKLIKAYECGFLYLIPQSLGGEPPSVPPKTFVDRRNRDHLGRLLEYGAIKGACMH